MQPASLRRTPLVYSPTSPPAPRQSAARGSPSAFTASLTIFAEVAATSHRLWADCRTRLIAWRKRARSRRELMTLGERELWDNHLTRCDAMKEAGKPFWHK